VSKVERCVLQRAGVDSHNVEGRFTNRLNIRFALDNHLAERDSVPCKRLRPRLRYDKKPCYQIYKFHITIDKFDAAKVRRFRASHNRYLQVIFSVAIIICGDAGAVKAKENSTNGNSPNNED
jgi:hypothetical protein